MPKRSVVKERLEKEHNSVEEGLVYLLEKYPNLSIAAAEEKLSYTALYKLARQYGYGVGLGRRDGHKKKR